jgi:spermidine/putrescine transport system permease protein
MKTSSPFAWFINRINKKTPTIEASVHAKRSWKKHNPQFSISRTILVLTLLFLFIPLFVIILFSFNNSKDTSFTGFSFIWYKKLFFDSAPLWTALFNSLFIALTASIVATILGTLAAIGMNWYKFFGKSYIQTISFLPMVLPEVIMGVSMLIFFSGLHVPLGLFTIFAAHTTFCLPFVYLMVSARIDEFDYSIIEASHDLGANEWQTLTRVIIPAIMPGILSGFMMSVTMSLEDYVITSLVSGPGSTTIPLYVYSMIRFGVSPVINSLSFVLVLATCLIAFILRKGLKSFAASH